MIFHKLPMTPLPGLVRPDEGAAERAYSAFIEATREFLPPLVQTWNELHPRVKAGWIAAAEAAQK